MPRIDKRNEDQIRRVRIVKDFMPNACGSCLIEFGRTRVLVSASVTDDVPPFIDEMESGWLTAEYSMLPGSTPVRKARERGRSDSRSIEIQRLVGRSLRAMVDFTAMPGITIHIDCDVIEADGGTRTASITGGYVALNLCVRALLAEGRISRSPLLGQVAAVSAGIVNGQALLDLCYTEDSSAEADMNFVGSEDGRIIEIQVCGEKRAISADEFDTLLGLCKKGVQQLVQIQKSIL